MVKTGLLAGVGDLVLTIVLGYGLSLLFRTRSPTKQLRLGISATMIGPWLVGLYIVLVLVIWKLIGKAG